MWHALIWTPVLLLVLLWSGLCWTALGVLLAIDWRAAAAVDWGRWMDQWQIPLWLAVWLPMDAITAMKAWLTAIGPGLQDAVAKFPSALEWIGPAVWALWGIGLLCLLAAGGLASLVVSVIQRGTGTRR